MAQIGPNMTPNGPKMTQNDLKWPKNDARIYALYPQYFLTEKAVLQTFSLLECMHCGLGLVGRGLCTKQRKFAFHAIKLERRRLRHVNHVNISAIFTIAVVGVVFVHMNIFTF